MVKLLIGHGADVNVQDEQEKSALLHAARVGDVSLILTLLDCGAAIDHADRLRYTPLLLCQLYKTGLRYSYF
ncbi:hypothetical protein PENSUB_6801 [Penicillium subrubescens]|uniref:Uncharacterized protein n=1 Tax=Penicillium subrubescens TaxID=1316194 RepID=A0A1Q5TU83_9EURO|nr:hypothetical protein PENSUB_6801 [Penicillium subrubescens]